LKGWVAISLHGPTGTSRDVRFPAAHGGEADIPAQLQQLQFVSSAPRTNSQTGSQAYMSATMCGHDKSSHQGARTSSISSWP